MTEKRKENILTARNGIALISVLAILLILTLFIPVMFSMADNATKEAVTGMDKQRASYLARTTIEMAVGAFEKEYELDPDNFNSLINDEGNSEKIDIEPVYMYKDNDLAIENDDANAAEKIKKQDEQNNGSDIHYSLSANEADTHNNWELLGVAHGEISYDGTVRYYKVTEEGEYEDITDENGAKQFEDYKTNLEKALKGEKDTSGNKIKVPTEEIVQQQSRKIMFSTTATVNKKSSKRSCVLVLPTDTAQKEWILPGSTDGNQVFANSKKATSVLAMNIQDESGESDEEQYAQPIYVFSSVGNLSINFDNLKSIKEEKVGDDTFYVSSGEDYEGDKSVLSFGVFPQTKTIPDNDHTFSCLKGVNMSAWSTSAQKENFIAFTATNMIEVEEPVKLLVFPTRTRLAENLTFKDVYGIIGSRSGTELVDNVTCKNHTLYKMLAFQAPDIVFKDEVISMISLYYKAAGTGNKAKRMTSLVFSAPASTPYMYYNKDRGKAVKAGRIFFLQDAYIWLIPYGEEGDGWKDPSGQMSFLGGLIKPNFNTPETVYYAGSNIKIIKIANAGDVYYFNSEVEGTTTYKNGLIKKETETNVVGFSLSGYFFDVLYTKELGNKLNNWWDVIDRVKSDLFAREIKNSQKNATYKKDDLQFIGNIYDGYQIDVPEAEDYVVYWES